MKLSALLRCIPRQSTKPDADRQPSSMLQLLVNPFRQYCLRAVFQPLVVQSNQMFDEEHANSQKTTLKL